MDVPLPFRRTGFESQQWQLEFLPDFGLRQPQRSPKYPHVVGGSKQRIMWILCAILLESLTIVSTLKDKTYCDGVEIVWREDWRARPIIHNRILVSPVNKVIIAHTKTSFCKTKPQCVRDVQILQDVTMDYKGMFDVPYNFLIGGDGRVYEGRGWREVGSHTIGYNYISIAIAFIGNYNTHKPTKKVLDAALNLIECGVKEGFLTPTREIHGHRDVLCTDSPGDNLYAAIRYWKNYKGGRIPNYECEPWLDV